MNPYLYPFLSSLIISTAFAQTQTQESKESFFNGNIYTRASLSYQFADDYYSGFGSTASTLFDEFDGDYSFINYNIDLVYIAPNGFYFGTGLYSSSAEIETSLGVPDTDTGTKLREIPIAIGYTQKIDSVRLRFEARYVFNVDPDFDDTSSVLSITDGSDSLTLSAKAKTDFIGFEHALLLGYQFYENDVEHPLFPSFSLGDRAIVDYEIAKTLGDLRLSAGHLFSNSQQTKGTPGFNGTAYLVEKPRFLEVRASVAYKLSPRLLIDGSLKYNYTGKDAPKQKTISLGIAYIF